MAALCQLQRPQQRLFTHVLDDAGVDAQLDANQLAAIAIKQLLKQVATIKDGQVVYRDLEC